MKTNKEYKSLALTRLSGNWAPMLIASIILFFVLFLCSGTRYWELMSYCFPYIASLKLSAVSIAVLEILGILLVLFVMNPIAVGYSNAMKVFFDTGDSDVTSNMFQIASGNYLRIVLSMAIMLVKILLWTCLLIVPGVIKSFSYALTPFILIDRPDLNVNEAIRESERLMKGHKLELFLLALSFIGWFILSVITLGIGFFWSYPYYMTAFVAFYNDIKSASTF